MSSKFGRKLVCAALTAVIVSSTITAPVMAKKKEAKPASLQELLAKREKKNSGGKGTLNLFGAVLGGVAMNQCERQGGGDLCTLVGTAVMAGTVLLGDEISKMLEKNDQQKVLDAASQSLKTGEPASIDLPDSAAVAEIKAAGKPVSKEAEVDVFYDKARVSSLSKIDVVAAPYTVSSDTALYDAPSAQAREATRLPGNSQVYVAGKVQGQPWYMVSEKVVEGDESALMIIGYVSEDKLKPAADNVELAGNVMPATLAEGKLKANLKCDEIDMKVRNEKGETAESKSVKCRGPEGQLLSA